MGNIDLLISIGIWVAGVGMSFVGIEMTIHPPNDKNKWVYRGLFSVMGVAFVGLSIWQFDRADRESKRLNTEHQQEQLRNEGNSKYMQGELDTMNKLISTVASNSDPKQLAVLLRGIVLQPLKGSPSLDVLCQNLADCPSAELSKRAVELASEIETTIIAPVNKKTSNLTAAMGKFPTTSPQYAELRDRAGTILHAEEVMALDKYRREYNSSVIAMRIVLMQRLGTHDTGKDSLYSGAAIENSSMYDLKEIANDLRDMAAKVLALRHQ